MTRGRAQPANIEGYAHTDRHRILQVEKGIGDVEEIPDPKVRRPHPRLAIVQVDGYAPRALVVLAAWPKRIRPEQATRVGMNPGVEVMHLGGEVSEVEPTSVEVKSNESERPPVNLPIEAD